MISEHVDCLINLPEEYVEVFKKEWNVGHVRVEPRRWGVASVNDEAWHGFGSMVCRARPLSFFSVQGPASSLAPNQSIRTGLKQCLQGPARWFSSGVSWSSVCSCKVFRIVSRCKINITNCCVALSLTTHFGNPDYTPEAIDQQRQIG